MAGRRGDGGVRTSRRTPCATGRSVPARRPGAVDRTDRPLGGSASTRCGRRAGAFFDVDGYPIYGYGGYYGVATVVTTSTQEAPVYSHPRPGYEVRTLLASANILAQRGGEQGCESLLGSARNIYSVYASELRNGSVPRPDMSAWRRQEIANEVAVKGAGLAFCSDQLVGSTVVNPEGVELGNVDDIVMSPQTGEIAYLVIARGGIFGFDKQYLPVPWEDFKVAAGHGLLVLDTVNATMEAAPQVKKSQNFQHADFVAESLKVDAYWVAHLAR